jgi:hypothetical protein
VTVLAGAALVVAPCLTIDKDHFWTMHAPVTLWPASVGIALVVISALAFLLTQLNLPKDDSGTGVDLKRVKEGKGVLWTRVAGCEIRVVNGRLEDYMGASPYSAVVLPCNEYFDDRCVDDARSALGAYANRVFEGQVADFVSLMKDECKNNLGPGTTQQKTDQESAVSFGVGRCVLLITPLGRAVPVALISTTTQRSGQGLSSRISYLFAGVNDLISLLANQRINEVVMPLLGSGHGGLDPPLALVALLGALAETARYGQGAQRLKKVTIVVFKRDNRSSPEVSPVVVRRALALVGTLD